MNFICDLDGVVYRGDTLVPGSDRALRRMIESGATLVFATNNSTKSPGSVAGKITRVTGVEIPAEWIVTSSQAAVSLLGPDGGPVLVLGSEGIHAALEEGGIEATEDPGLARAVMVGLDWDLTYDRLARASDAVRGGARFIATNTDPTYPIVGGLLPGGGSMVAAVAATTGIEPEIAGKPHPAMRALLRDRVGGGKTWVIGDRVDTDVAMAEAEPDWEAVLVMTGVTDPGEGGQGHLSAPDLETAVEMALTG